MEKMNIGQAKEILNSSVLGQYSYAQIAEAVKLAKAELSAAEFKSLVSGLEGLWNIEEIKNRDTTSWSPDDLAKLDIVNYDSNAVTSDAHSQRLQAILAEISAGRQTLNAEEFAAAQYLSNTEWGSDYKDEINGLIQTYDVANNADADKEVFEQNLDIMELTPKTIKAGKQNLDYMQEVEGLIARLEFAQPDKDIGFEKLTSTEASKYVDVLKSAAFLEAQIANLGRASLLNLSKEQKEDKIYADYVNILTDKLARVALSNNHQSDIEDLAGDSTDVLTQRQFVSNKAVLQDFANKKKSVKISSDGILIACVDTSANVKEYNTRIEGKFGKGNNVSQVIRQKHNAFSEKCKGIWGKRWNIARSAVENVRKNKWQVGSALVGGIGFAILSAQVTWPLVAGYIGYNIASAWVAPIIDEAASLRKAAKKEGRKCGFFKSFGRAAKKLFADKKYKKKAWIQSGCAVALGGVLSFAGLASATRSVFALSKTAATSIYQGTETVAAKRAWKASPNDDTKRANLKRARWALGIGSVVSLGLNLLNYERVTDTSAVREAASDSVTKSLLPDSPVLPADTTSQTFPEWQRISTVWDSGNEAEISTIDPIILENTPAEIGDATQVADSVSVSTSVTPEPTDDAVLAATPVNPTASAEAVVPVSGEPELFADTWSADMGISKAQYNLLTKLYSAEDLDRMSVNLTSSGAMGYFSDMTKEQVLFKYQRLSAWTDIVDSKTGLSIPGATRHHFDSEMKALNKLLNCGEQISAKDYAGIDKMFDNITDKGDILVGKTNLTDNRMIGGAIYDKDCPEATDKFFMGEKKVNVPQADKPVSEVVETKASAPVTTTTTTPVQEAELPKGHYDASDEPTHIETNNVRVDKNGLPRGHATVELGEGDTQAAALSDAANAAEQSSSVHAETGHYSHDDYVNAKQQAYNDYVAGQKAKFNRFKQGRVIAKGSFRGE